MKREKYPDCIDLKIYAKISSSLENILLFMVHAQFETDRNTCDNIDCRFTGYEHLRNYGNIEIELSFFKTTDEQLAGEIGKSKEEIMDIIHLVGEWSAKMLADHGLDPDGITWVVTQSTGEVYHL